MGLMAPTYRGTIDGMDVEGIRSLRHKLELSQVRFAQKLGVARQTVERWEAGQVKPRGLALAALERLKRQAERAERKEAK